MRILVFTNTPAHVHTYRNAVRALEARGHEVLILARDYDCTTDLLTYYDLPFVVYGRHGTDRYTRAAFAREFLGHMRTAVREARRFDPDVIFGRGVYAAYTGALLRTRTVLLLDSEPSTFAHSIASPFASLVLSPRAFETDLGKRHYTFAGFKECGYLHPDVFAPDRSVREELGVASDERFVLVRFNSYNALHDVGDAGLTDDERRRLVETLAEYATVFVSDESGTFDFDDVDARPYALHPARIHDVLAEASLLVAETGTMVTEAALLGTPAIACGAFVAWRLGEFVELEHQDLISATTDFDEIVECATMLLTDPSTEATWTAKRDDYMRDKVNLTDLLVRAVEAPATLSDLGLIVRHGTEPDPAVGLSTTKPTTTSR